MYIDCRHFYGWTMCKRMTKYDIRRIKIIENFDIMSIADGASEGYILEENTPTNTMMIIMNFPFLLKINVHQMKNIKNCSLL